LTADTTRGDAAARVAATDARGKWLLVVVARVRRTSRAAQYQCVSTAGVVDSIASSSSSWIRVERETVKHAHDSAQITAVDSDATMFDRDSEQSTSVVGRA